MKKRRCTDAIKTTISLAILLLIMSGPAMVKAQDNNGSKSREGSLATADITDALMIPPIDAAGPPDFQTASFGLG